MLGNEQVRVEMETFLKALDSYADRVATNPSLTFEAYRASLTAAVHTKTPAGQRTTREN